MTVPNSRDVRSNQVSRRKILSSIQTAGLIGISGGFVGSVNAVRGSDQIVTHRSAHGIEHTKKVPKKWIDHIERIERVRKNLQDSHQGYSSVKNIALVRSEKTYGGKHGLKIEVEVGTTRARNNIPDSIDGIPITTTDVRERKLEGCWTNDACYNESVYDNTPGGVAFAGNGTSCCQYYVAYPGTDGHLNQTMLTASHAIGDKCSDDIQWTRMYQHCEEWGDVVRHAKAIDVVACNPAVGGKSVDNTILTESGEIPVSGYVTKYGLEDMVSYNAYVEKTGITTGTTVGTMQRIDENKDGLCGLDSKKRDIAAAKLDTAAGDSGSPVYDWRDGEAYMISLHQTGGSNTDGEACNGNAITTYSHGATAYEINDYLDGQFVAPI